MKAVFPLIQNVHYVCCRVSRPCPLLKVFMSDATTFVLFISNKSQTFQHDHLNCDSNLRGDRETNKHTHNKLNLKLHIYTDTNTHTQHLLKISSVPLKGTELWFVLKGQREHVARRPYGVT